MMPHFIILFLVQNLVRLLKHGLEQGSEQGLVVTSRHFLMTSYFRDAAAKSCRTTFQESRLKESASSKYAVAPPTNQLLASYLPQLLAPVTCPRSPQSCRIVPQLPALCNEKCYVISHCARVLGRIDGQETGNFRAFVDLVPVLACDGIGETSNRCLKNVATTTVQASLLIIIANLYDIKGAEISRFPPDLLLTNLDHHRYMGSSVRRRFPRDHIVAPVASHHIHLDENTVLMPTPLSTRWTRDRAS
jgi:hypothetical protein